MAPTLRRRELMLALGIGVPTAVAMGCDKPASRSSCDGALLGQDMSAGHRLRDGAMNGFPPADKVHSCDVLIVGGGIAGLSAAWWLVNHGVPDVVVLELESVVGGTSRSAESASTAYPWGAHYIPMPNDRQTELRTLLREIGALETLPDGREVGHEDALVRAPDERVFSMGFWEPGIVPRAGQTDDDRRDLLRFERIIDGYVGFRDREGRRAFTLPLDESSTDPELRALDEQTARQWLDRQQLRSPFLRRMIDYSTRDDYGMGIGEVSAWAMLFYFASRKSQAGGTSQCFLTWPEGNGRLVRHLTERLSGKVRLARPAFRVSPAATHVDVHALRLADNRAERYRARHVVSAMPSFVADRVLPAELRTDYRPPVGAWMVANLHLAERPYGRGHPPCWDNVLWDSPSVGYVDATHQSGADHGPTVWTYYLPLTDADPARARQVLSEPTWEEWRDLIIDDLSRAHPGLSPLIDRIDVFRWAHAMVQPRPGVIHSSSRRNAQKQRGRVSFAHTDLSGVALFEEAFAHGIRAAKEAKEGLSSAGSDR